ncbi:MAG: hypothetical protein J4F48_10095 [Nitrospinae bacterium]|nr:hypothetical protein [Nitrospinota bacterium]
MQEDAFSGRLRADENRNVPEADIRLVNRPDIGSLYSLDHTQTAFKLSVSTHHEHHNFDAIVSNIRRPTNLAQPRIMNSLFKLEILNSCATCPPGFRSPSFLSRD